MDWQEYGVRRQLGVTQRRNDTFLNTVEVAGWKRNQQPFIVQPDVAALS